MAEEGPSIVEFPSGPPSREARTERLGFAVIALAAMTLALALGDWLLLGPASAPWRAVLAARLALLAVLALLALGARRGALARLLWENPGVAGLALAILASADFAWCAAKAGALAPLYLSSVNLIVITWCFLLADALWTRALGGLALLAVFFGGVAALGAPAALLGPKGLAWMPLLVLLSCVGLGAATDHVRRGGMREIWQRGQKLATTDEVTGLYNTRYMREVLERESYRAHRYGTPLSVVFLDLDYFKRVNDAHGHLVGTRLLKEVGEVLLENLRESDYAIRYGGDEFVLILPGTSREQAQAVAERVHAAIDDRSFLAGDSLSLRVTVSLGVASLDGGKEAGTALLARADQAMYWVKEHGRDGVHVV